MGDVEVENCEPYAWDRRAKLKLSRGFGGEEGTHAYLSEENRKQRQY